MVARRRRIRRTHSRRHDMMSTGMSWINRLIGPSALVVAMVGQVTAKDVQAYPGYNALPNMEKGKFLLNNTLSRMSGFSPFPQYGTPGFTINLTGPINKYTGLGIGLQILGAVTKQPLARKAGKGLMWGGIIGGIFDPATGAKAGGSTPRGTATPTIRTGYSQNTYTG